MLNLIVERMREKGIALTINEDAVSYLAKDGFDPQYGARPLRRAIQRKVEDALSESLVSGALQEGDSVTVFMKDGKLDHSITKKKPDQVAEETPVG